jgi:hypothetical protein
MPPDLIITLSNEALLAKGHSVLSKSLRELFVPDNDHCSCAQEFFDKEDEPALVLGNNSQIMTVILGDRIVVPTIPYIDDDMVLRLLQNCFQYAIPISRNDPDYAVKYPTCIGRSRNGFDGFVFMDIDDTYLVPEPEYFGAYINNYIGFGVFCLPEAMRKVI